MAKNESRTKNLEELPVEAPPEGKARIPWQIPAMPPGQEPIVKVVTLIGRSAGSVVEMPKSAAQAALAMGTAQRAPGETYTSDFPGGNPPVLTTEATQPQETEVTVPPKVAEKLSDATVADAGELVSKAKKVEQLDVLEKAEREGKNRKGVFEQIEKRRAELAEPEE